MSADFQAGVAYRDEDWVPECAGRWEKTTKITETPSPMIVNANVIQENVTHVEFK